MMTRGETLMEPQAAPLRAPVPARRAGPGSSCLQPADASHGDPGASAHRTSSDRDRGRGPFKSDSDAPRVSVLLTSSEPLRRTVNFGSIEWHTPQRIGPSTYQCGGGPRSLFGPAFKLRAAQGAAPPREGPYPGRDVGFDSSLRGISYSSSKGSAGPVGSIGTCD